MYGDKEKMNKKILLSITLLIGISIFFLVYFQNQKTKFQKVSPHIGEIIEAIYGLGTVKTDQKYEVKVGVITTLKNVFVKEGDNIEEGNPLVHFEGIGPFFSPFSGTVTNVFYQKGETVLPQISVLKLENLKKLYIEVSLEQDGALRVRPGQKAIVIFESIRNLKHEGVVRSIFPKNDEFIARIEVENLTKNILTGMTADVAIEVGRHKDALLIPVASIQDGKIIVERNGKKIKEQVEIGKMDAVWAQVVSKNITVSDILFIKR